MNLPQFKKYLPISLAVIIAVIAVVIYIYSGQGSLDQNTRKLEQNPQIKDLKLEQTDAGQKNAQINCQDGSNYDVYIPPGTSNYDALSAIKCEPASNV